MQIRIRGDRVLIGDREDLLGKDPSGVDSRIDQMNRRPHPFGMVLAESPIPPVHTAVARRDSGVNVQYGASQGVEHPRGDNAGAVNNDGRGVELSEQGNRLIVIYGEHCDIGRPRARVEGRRSSDLGTAPFAGKAKDWLRQGDKEGLARGIHPPDLLRTPPDHSNARLRRLDNHDQFLDATLEIVGDDIRTFVRAGQENDTFAGRHRTHSAL